MDHAKVLAEVAARYSKTRAERDAAIVAASKAGMSYRAIGEIVGLSYSRVMQIVRS